jgi:butyrate kinase
MTDPTLLVINPGSTTTKIGLFSGTRELKTTEIVHPKQELSAFSRNLDQVDYRRKALSEALVAWEVAPRDLSAIIGRGGPLKPLEGGVYRVDEELVRILRSGNGVDHASILGGLLAYELASRVGIPAFFADPVSVDEFDDLARISGFPELPRISLGHALNIKAVVAEVAEELGKPAGELNLVVAHLGGGISIAANRRGRMVDLNNANDAGPFSPERAGTLPLTGLLKLCFSGKYSYEELRKKLIGQGGLLAHLGTADVRDVEKRIIAGDNKARLILEAMAYTIAKEIGAMAVVLAGKVDAIVLTGGIAYSERVTTWISERVRFIAPVILKPGQNELRALARHAVLGLNNPGIVKTY